MPAAPSQREKFQDHATPVHDSEGMKLAASQENITQQIENDRQAVPMQKQHLVSARIESNLAPHENKSATKRGRKITSGDNGTDAGAGRRNARKGTH